MICIQYNSLNLPQSIAIDGKELDKMHGLNMYDYSARHYDAAIGRFTTIDPHAERYYSWSPYVYVMNNPMKYIDPRGDSAWSVTRDWDELDAAKFAEYAEKRLQDYINKNIDCGNLAIAVLIDYASSEGLALTFNTKDGKTFDSNSDVYNSVEDFKYGAKDGNKRDASTSVFDQVNSVDIPSNTYTIDKSEAQAGDMIVLSKPQGHVVNYSKVPESGSRELIYGNVGAPVKKTGDWTHVTKDSKGLVYEYVPNNKVAHRWKVLE